MNKSRQTDFENVLSQVLGFIVGPGLQAATTPLGVEGFIFLGLPINMYTTAGWINVLMGIANFIFFLPSFFTEHKIAAREAMCKQGKKTGIFSSLIYRSQLCAIFTCITTIIPRFFLQRKRRGNASSPIT